MFKICVSEGHNKKPFRFLKLKLKREYYVNNRASSNKYLKSQTKTKWRAYEKYLSSLW